MSEAFYVLIAGFTTDALLNLIDMDDTFRRRTGHSLYPLDGHISYLGELRGGEPLQVRTRVVDVDHRWVHVVHDLRHAADGHSVATEELATCNVDTSTGRPAPLLPEIRTALGELLAAHRRLSVHERLGRCISVTR